jgi:hypothetical protein
VTKRRAEGEQPRRPRPSVPLLSRVKKVAVEINQRCEDQRVAFTAQDVLVKGEEGELKTAAVTKKMTRDGVGGRGTVQYSTSSSALPAWRGRKKSVNVD